MNKDRIPIIIAILFWFCCFCGLTYSFFNSRNTENINPVYKRINTPCECVIDDKWIGGVFKDRYIFTNKNRYKVYERDNIVIGDSICEYKIDFGDENYDIKKWIKNKDISIYE